MLQVIGPIYLLSSISTQRLPLTPMPWMSTFFVNKGAVLGNKLNPRPKDVTNHVLRQKDKG
jgi:hypothetical protein